MSELKVNKVSPQSGTDFTLGDSGDTFTVPSGATLTVAGTFTQTGAQTFDGGVDIDNFNINGTTIALSSGDMTLDVAGDIILDADGGEILFHDATTAMGHISMASSNITLKSLVSDKDIIFQGNDGGAGITALTLDMSAAGAATFNNAITSGAVITSGAGLVIADTGNIGSASDTDAIAIAADGVVTFSQAPVLSGASLTAGTTPLTTLDIDGGTDIGAAIVDADLFIVDDGAGGTNRKVTASRIKTYAGGLTGVSTGSGNVTITDGNLIVASGHGIDFAATADSSGGNIGELLDDYETGSFTPSYTVAGGSVTMGTQRGEYVKVGNLVYVQMEFSTNGISSPSNDVGITGLPFTTGDETASALAIGILYRWNTDFDGDLIFRIPQDGVIVDIWKNASNSGSANRMQGSDFLDGSAKNALVVSGCYSVR